MWVSGKTLYNVSIYLQQGTLIPADVYFHSQVKKSSYTYM